jgi:hypothetical protein
VVGDGVTHRGARKLEQDGTTAPGEERGFGADVREAKHSGPPGDLLPIPLSHSPLCAGQPVRGCRAAHA